ncbi:hypothetical protein [Pseudogemmobacter sonorensis]|uniref:hypothetical protein n=1 Tax=Pseudogemmobacter sonorensis TaxID=2989681 RepID=UPI00367CD672
MSQAAELIGRLDAIRAHLLAGDLSALAAPDAVLDAAGLPADRSGAQAAQAAARRNLALIEAALCGVRAARRHVEEIAGRARLSTYDASGRIDRTVVRPGPPLRRS